jgi:hypothetical protein
MPMPLTTLSTVCGQSRYEQTKARSGFQEDSLKASGGFDSLHANGDPKVATLGFEARHCFEGQFIRDAFDVQCSAAVPVKATAVKLLKRRSENRSLLVDNTGAFKLQGSCGAQVAVPE